MRTGNVGKDFLEVNKKRPPPPHPKKILTIIIKFKKKKKIFKLKISKYNITIHIN